MAWKLQQGDILTLHLDQQAKVVSSLPAGDAAVSLEAAMEIAWRVIETDDDGVATIEQSVRRGSFKAGRGEETVAQFDSSQSDEQQAKGFEELRRMLRSKQRLKISARGEILSVEPLDKDDQEHDQTALADRDTLAKLLTAVFPTLPPGPVEKNDRWTGEQSFSTPLGRATLKRTYAYQGGEVKDGKLLDRIDVAGELKLDKQDQSPARLTDHAYSSVVHFNAEKGRIHAAEAALTLDFQTQVGEDLQQVRQKTETTYKLRVETAKEK